MDKECSIFETTLKILKENKIKPKKKLGQSFLVSCEVLRKIIDYVDPKPNDIILEIGAGIGLITEKLAKKCKEVIAVEIDDKLFSILRRRLKNIHNVRLIHMDFLKMEIPKVDIIFSNTPFSVSSNILIKILKEDNFDKAVLTFQREFGERLIAQPGTKKYGRLSVFVKIFSDIELKDIIPRSAFFPQPEVESRIVIIFPKKIDFIDIDLFEKFTSLLFSQRRRTLYSALKHVRSDLIDVLSTEGKHYLKRRVYQLSPEDIVFLFNVFKTFL
ncbi:MAG: ribosomal RNA small subunit methyltransferase A [Thermoproteales archaeon]|nr:ribosomal RNA small subunit methyltransferase A [Thermoproteales archaeon]